MLLCMSHPNRGLDQRHRDRNGEISKKHGSTLVTTLRKIYGATFAAGFQPYQTLSDVLDEPSLRQLIRHHESGELPRLIQGTY